MKKILKNLFKWDTKKHDEKIETEKAKVLREKRERDLTVRVNLMYKDWRKRVEFACRKGQIKTRKDLQDSFQQFKLNIQEIVGNSFEHQSWLKATMMMLDDAIERIGRGMFSTNSGSGEPGSIPVGKKGIPAPQPGTDPRGPRSGRRGKWNGKPSSKGFTLHPRRGRRPRGG